MRDENGRLEALAARATLWVAIFTALLFVAAVFQFATSYLQWRELRSSGKQTDELILRYGRQIEALLDQAQAEKATANAMQAQAEQTRRIAENASKQAADADRQLSNEKQSVVINNRAYVQLNTFNFEAVIDKDGKVDSWKIHPVWYNTGSTPTRDMWNNLSSKVSSDVISECPFDYANKEDRSANIGSKATLRGGQIVISKDDAIRIYDGKSNLYIWGYTKYRDIFPGTPIRETRYCVRFDFTFGDLGLPWDANKNNVGSQINFIGNHNCTDEGCKK